MHQTIARSLLVFALLPACFDKDGTSDTSDAGDTAGDGGDGADGGSDAPFYASGTYDGEPFEVDCYFDGSDADWTAGLQCQDGIQFFVTCRLDPEDAPVAGLEPDQFQVWFYLHNDYASVGTHDAAGNTGICVGDNMSAPLCTNYGGELESASITVDAIEPWTSAAGSFSASWSDAGEHSATITGSFDFACEG